MRRGDHAVFYSLKQRVSGFGVSATHRPRRAAANRYLCRRIRRSSAIEPSCIGVSAGIRRTGSGRNIGRRVTSDVRNHQRQHARAALRGGRCGQWPPAICDKCLRTMFISPIGAPLASSMRVTDFKWVIDTSGTGRLSRLDPPPEINTSSRSSRCELRNDCRMSLRRRFASVVGHRVSCFHDTNVLGRCAVCVTRDHQSFERNVGPRSLDRKRHAGGCLAPPLRRRPGPLADARQVGSDDAQRIGGRHRCVEARPHQFYRTRSNSHS